MKVKYVFLFEDTAPLDMQSCYIFDNFDDAKNFFFEKGFRENDDCYNCYNSFNIVSIRSGIAWYGSIHKGYYH